MVKGWLFLRNDFTIIKTNEVTVEFNHRWQCCVWFFAFFSHLKVQKKKYKLKIYVCLVFFFVHWTRPYSMTISSLSHPLGIFLCLFSFFTLKLFAFILFSRDALRLFFPWCFKVKVRLTTKNTFDWLSETLHLSAHVKWTENVVHLIVQHGVHSRAALVSVSFVTGAVIFRPLITHYSIFRSVKTARMFNISRRIRLFY